MLKAMCRTYLKVNWQWAILLAVLMCSCQDEDCVSVSNNDFLIGFVKADTLESGKVIYENVDTLFYKVTAESNDSILYDWHTRSLTFALPVNPASDITTFHLEMLDSIRYDTLSLDPLTIDTIMYVNPMPQTISVSYEQRQRIIAEDCGVEISYVKLQVDETTFPATELTEDKLSRFNEVNLEIFF